MAPKRRGKKPPLEVVSQMDGAWYDGDISLEGSRVRVHFSGFGSEDDEFWEGECLKSPTKLMEIMRLRSKQLQDSHCTKVSVGMVVCANFKTPDGAESKYYDAKVLIIHQCPHSFQKSGKKELCKCRFKLAWEAGPCKHQEVYLGCADISFIDPEGVERHPVAREVLQGARDYAQESKDVVTDEPGQILPTEDVNVNSVDAATDEPDLILPTEDVEVNCVDAVSDDPPLEKRGEGLSTSKDTEGLPQDFIRKVQNYNHFYEFLGEQADILKEALDKYNARNNINFT